MTLQFEGLGFSKSEGNQIKKKLYIISELIPVGETNIINLDVSEDFVIIDTVLKNGQEIYENYDYTVSGKIITFTIALTSDDRICVKGE